MSAEFRQRSIEATWFPTPRVRREDSMSLFYTDGKKVMVGDIVRALKGSVEGMLGVVVVDRNGNYEDYEPYTNQDSIGFVVFPEVNSEIVQLIESITNDPESLYDYAARWADTPDQLELVLASTEF